MTGCSFISLHAEDIARTRDITCESFVIVITTTAVTSTASVAVVYSYFHLFFHYCCHCHCRRRCCCSCCCWCTFITIVMVVVGNQIIISIENPWLISSLLFLSFLLYYYSYYYYYNRTCPKGLRTLLLLLIDVNLKTAFYNGEIGGADRLNLFFSILFPGRKPILYFNHVFWRGVRDPLGWV